MTHKLLEEFKRKDDNIQNPNCSDLKKNVEELLDIVKDMKMKRTRPNYYYSRNKNNEKFKNKLNHLKESADAAEVLNSIAQDNEFSIRRLREIKGPQFQNVYKKGFYVIYGQDQENNADDDEEMTINLKKESLMQKILTVPYLKVPDDMDNADRFEILFINDLNKNMSIKSRKLLKNK